MFHTSRGGKALSIVRTDPFTHFAGYDGNGNVTLLATASSGATTAHYEYDPFGNVLQATEPVALLNPIRFSSKYTDGNTELNYYGFRFYSTATGRWLSRDSKYEGKVNKATSKQHELEAIYSFADNTPVIKVDRLGKDLWYCTAPAFFDGAWATHAYMWDDRPDEEGPYTGGQDPSRGCAMQSVLSSGGNSKPKDIGPPPGFGGDSWTGEFGRSCSRIPDSAGKEYKALQCCHRYANIGIWVPYFWDCHTANNHCLRRAGIPNPPDPGRINL